MNTSPENPSNGSENSPSLEQTFSELRKQLDTHLATCKQLAGNYRAGRVELISRVAELERSCSEAKAITENASRDSARMNSRLSGLEKKIEAWTQAQAPILEILKTLPNKL